MGFIIVDYVDFANIGTQLRIYVPGPFLDESNSDYAVRIRDAFLATVDPKPIWSSEDAYAYILAWVERNRKGLNLENGLVHEDIDLSPVKIGLPPRAALKPETPVGRPASHMDGEDHKEDYPEEYETHVGRPTGHTDSRGYIEGDSPEEYE